MKILSKFTDEGKKNAETLGIADKRNLSERDICTKFITPALREAGWDEMTQFREEVSITKGPIRVQGKMCNRGKRKRADYILDFIPYVPLAVIEAKRNTYNIGDGIQQALDYAERMDIPFAFSSNGDGFVFHDRTGTSANRETSIALGEFPSPAELWGRYLAWKGLTPESEEIVLRNYHEENSGKTPRYYQVRAINAVSEAIAKGQTRILLVMATGTGKTYTAFQIIWRLWKAGQKKRILFLADRNVLVDQAINNDFRPFGGAMTKLKRSIDKSFEIYLGLYQAITGPEEHQKTFKEFSPTFFDLIVIDECHRGSADEDSAWHEILEYFSSATQIGLTATPKETKYVSNIAYFGEPIFTYSLKQGIEDGFLAPYKVIRVHIDRDIEGWHPEPGKLDDGGEEVEGREYNITDFDRTLVIKERTDLVAQRITDFLKDSGNRFQKTIIFCVDQEHASRMRQELINKNSDVVTTHPRYVMRITGNDPVGQSELSNFIDPESKCPVLVTTSRLLSTGVDAQTCRLIVLDRKVGSMTEFKQIIGRGTRLHEETGKFFFTIIDFRGATRHFYDPEFDGEPVQIYEPSENDPILPPEEEKGTNDNETPTDGGETSSCSNKQSRRKIYVDGVAVERIAEREFSFDEDGREITQTLQYLTRKAVRRRYRTIDDFLMRWNAEDRKQAIIDEMESEGLPITDIVQQLGKDLDPFDLICHIAFDTKPLTRRERAENVKKRDVFTKYGDQACAVLDALLDKYADEGVLNLGDTAVLKIPPFNHIGTPIELVDAFGGKSSFERAVHDLQSALYKKAA